VAPTTTAQYQLCSYGEDEEPGVERVAGTGVWGLGEPGFSEGISGCLRGCHLGGSAGLISQLRGAQPSGPQSEEDRALGLREFPV
jgi:hypothetical protein